MTSKKTVVVTGGGRGLGLAIVAELIDAGYNVVAISRTKTPEIEALGSKQFEFIPYDFIDLDGIHELTKQIRLLVKARFDDNVYGLINNAALGTDGVLGTMHQSDINQLLAVNVQAPILLTKYLSRQMMLKQVKGRIINIGSIIASTGYSGLSVYAATKAAMEGFSRSLAREVGKLGITVNVIAPGFMETNMTSTLGAEQLEQIRRRSALGQFATPKSVAHMALHLLSSESSTITGTVLTVDGGSTA